LDQQDQLVVVVVVNLRVEEDFLEAEDFLVAPVDFLEAEVVHHHKYRPALMQHPQS
jgi:hypothetical protein